MMLAFHVTKVAKSAVMTQTNALIAEEATISKEPNVLDAPKIVLIAIQQNVLNANRISTQMGKSVHHVQKFVSDVMVQQQMIAWDVILVTIFLGRMVKMYALNVMIPVKLVIIHQIIVKNALKDTSAINLLVNAHLASSIV